MPKKVQKGTLSQVVQANVRAMRIAKGMTQKELADKIGLQVQAVSRIENSPQNMSLGNLEKIAGGKKIFSNRGEQRDLHKECCDENPQTRWKDRMAKMLKFGFRQHLHVSPRSCERRQ